jgi:DNA invertase Pin-like site-specific DNA recombinase
VLIGYARVSTQDQNLELQREALTAAGCKKIFEDKISGARVDRPGLAKVLELLRDGDTLVVWKLDRLGRSVKQLVDLVGELHKQGVQFRSLTDSIDTGTPSGRFFFHVMASLAEMERDLVIERTRAGLDAARSRGRTGGRKRKMTNSKIASAMKLLADGTPPRDVAKDLGVSIATLYRWLPASPVAETATNRAHNSAKETEGCPNTTRSVTGRSGRRNEANQPRVATILLRLRIANNDKSVRGINRAIKHIKTTVLYGAKRRADGEYEIRYLYFNDKGLDSFVRGLLSKIASAADDYNCFSESEAYEEGTDRQW